VPINFVEDTDSLTESLVKSIDYDDEDLVEDPLADLYEGKEVALKQLKVDAREVASFENDIDHSPGLSWHAEFTLFVAPIPTLEGGFALLNLDWDDNYGRWEWRCETALTGASSMDEAIGHLLEKYKDSYIAGAQDEFREFLESLC
jgi:hypothetical protein